MRITAAVLSPNIETSLTGQVGRELLAQIIAFQRKVFDPVTKLEVGEIAIETSTHLIEVTNESDGVLEKLLTLKNDPVFNPEQKTVVLYAPSYSRQAARDVVEESIPVIQSLEQLSAYAQKIR
jgi:hypothetical protein